MIVDGGERRDGSAKYVLKWRDGEGKSEEMRGQKYLDIRNRSASAYAALIPPRCRH